jgi:hypothetical protein
MTTFASSHPSVGRIHAILDNLIQERHRLRRDRSELPLLEANRLAIIYWQQELSRALAASQDAGARDERRALSDPHR